MLTRSTLPQLKAPCERHSTIFAHTVSALSLTLRLALFGWPADRVHSMWHLLLILELNMNNIWL